MESIVSDCIYDMCGADSSQIDICDYLAMYAEIGIRALGGQPMPHWRSDILCRKLLSVA